MKNKVKVLLSLLLCSALVFSFVSCSNERDKNFQSDADILAFVKNFDDSHSETVVISFKNEVSVSVTELISYPGKTEEELSAIRESLELAENETASASGSFITVERSSKGKYKDTAFDKEKNEISEYFISQGYSATEIKIDSSGLNN